MFFGKLSVEQHSSMSTPMNRTHSPAPSTIPSSSVGVPMPSLERRLCQRLRGEQYTEYLLSTSTRSLGGISSKLRSRTRHQLFPYKFPVKNGTANVVPSDGNVHVDEKRWTHAEQRHFDRHLHGFSRWIVDFEDRSVRSTSCEGNTTNATSICVKCEGLSKDESLKHALRRVSAPC